MERREFLGRGAAVGSAVLAKGAFEFARRDLGLGPTTAPTREQLPPRATSVAGQITDVSGPTVRVDLSPTGSLASVGVEVVRREYPTGEALGRSVRGDVDLTGSDREASTRIVVPREGREAGSWFYEVYVHSGGEDAPAYLCESAPYEWVAGRDTVATAADRIVDARESASDKRFTRELAGSDYVLWYRWPDVHRTTWTVEYRVRRSTYEAAVAGERGYVTTYEEALSSAVARDVAATIASDARGTPRRVGNDAERDQPVCFDSLDAGRRFDGLVRFVQFLEYARDAASRGTYDYNRTVAETLVAGVGDCKDRTHLLAGLLSAAFDARTALLFQAGHLLLGVDPDDVPPLPYDYDAIALGGREYVPVEPSMQVPVGYYPDEPFITVYGDGEWQHRDVGAMVEGVDDLARDFVEKSDWVPNAR